MAKFKPLPTGVWVGAAWISIKRAKDLRHPDNKEKKLHGLWDPETAAIFISEDLPMARAWWVLLHELGHAAIDLTSCISLTPAQEERLIDGAFMTFVATLMSLDLVRFPHA